MKRSARTTKGTMRVRGTAIAAVVMLAQLVLVPRASATHGPFDSSFGTRGKVTTDTAQLEVRALIDTLISAVEGAP